MQSSAGGNSSGSMSSSSKNASKSSHMQQLPGMSNDLSQAFLAEMAAQAMAAAGGQLPLTGPGSLASLTGNLAGIGTPTSNNSSSSSSSKRQREQEAFKQQMDYYTKTLGLGSGISLIPTSSASGSGNSAGSVSFADDHHKSKRSRNDMQQLNAKDELAAAALAAGLPLNFGSGGMTSIEKNLRSGNNSGIQEADKVTLTPLNSAGIAANLPSQTTITIAPPITSSASSSSERSERNNESRISLTITNAADAAKLPPPYEEADELIIQPILKKQSSGNNNNNNNNSSSGAASSSHSGSMEDLESAGGDDNRRSSSRLKRPRSGADHTMHGEQPPEKRRELRSTRHTRQSSNMDATLNLSGNSDVEEKHD